MKIRLTAEGKGNLMKLVELRSPLGACGKDNIPVPVNFVQILTDDQGWGDLSCFGHPFIKSPHLDQLAVEGMKFTQCYAADSVCSPSRAAILTGRTPFRNGVYRWIPYDHFCHLPGSEVTTPRILRENGYQTAHFGKWHLSYYDEKSVRGKPEETHGFRMGGELAGQPTMNDYGYDYWFATGNVARPNHRNPRNFFLNGKAVGELQGFSAQIVAREFTAWLKEHREESRPFFVTVWFHEPHGPINSDPEYLERYPEIDDPSLRQYYANITQIDEAVGVIVNALKQAGLFDNTILSYTSDNGPEGKHEFGTFNTSDSPYDGSRNRGSTGGLRGRKKHTHEGGIRVPGIVSWPKGFRDAGVAPGTICPEPVIGSDFFATTLDAAGLPIPDDRPLDCESILPLLQNRPFKRDKPLYWRNTFFEFTVALREGNWKILADPLRKKFELHNLVNDPRETADVSEHYPEVFEEMKQKLIAYDDEVLTEGPKWWRDDTRPGTMNQLMPEPMW